MLVYFLTIILWVGCAPFLTTQQQTAERDLDITEAVLRYMFKHEPPEQPSFAKVLFISVPGDGVEDKLIDRFKDHKPRVKKKSEDMSNSHPGGVLDSKTGERGVLYQIRKFKWISETELDVTVSYFVADLNAGGCEYRVVLENDKWNVKGCGKRRWIS